MTESICSLHNKWMCAFFSWLVRMCERLRERGRGDERQRDVSHDDKPAPLMPDFESIMISEHVVRLACEGDDTYINLDAPISHKMNYFM